jgi:hypothetical protein
MKGLVAPSTPKRLRIERMDANAPPPSGRLPRFYFCNQRRGLILFLRRCTHRRVRITPIAIAVDAGMSQSQANISNS